MRIKISDVRNVTNKLFDYLEEAGHHIVEIDMDYYWEVEEEQRYVPMDEPTLYSVGQLTDDWSEISKILDGQDDPIGYALVWLSSILRVIGEKYSA